VQGQDGEPGRWASNAVLSRGGSECSVDVERERSGASFKVGDVLDIGPSLNFLIRSYLLLRYGDEALSL
jgi:hypothetical protein